MSNSPKTPFYQSDFDLDQRNLILKLELDMVEVSHHTTKEVFMSMHSKKKKKEKKKTHTLMMKAYDGGIKNIQL